MNLPEMLERASDRPWEWSHANRNIFYFKLNNGEVDNVIQVCEKISDANGLLATYAVNHLESHLEQIRQLREALACLCDSIGMEGQVSHYNSSYQNCYKNAIDAIKMSGERLVV